MDRNAAKRNPLGWEIEAIEAWVAGRGQPGFRARQLARRLFAAGETDPAAMTELPPALRRALAEECPPLLPVVSAERTSTDGTRKFLLRLADGEEIEMVIIPDEDRRTLCFSTQAGCPVGCLFCSTGLGGFRRNLDAAEIVGQVLLARKLVGPGAALTNLVVMGMGEPLLNAEEVTRALVIITAPWGLNITPRRITLSTVGVTPRLAELRERFPALNLALSINAADPELRERLMPGTRAWPLKDLLRALDRLPGRSRHPLTLEYVLLAGVNDRPEDAARLARMLSKRDWPVNLIPLNDSGEASFQAPSAEAAERFAAVLRAAGVVARLRRSRGGDIEAACGQLRGGAREGGAG